MPMTQNRETLRGLEAPDLRQKLLDSKEELFNLRFQLATGSSTDNAEIRRVRRQIARIHTILREKELNIVAPAKKVVAAKQDAAPKKKAAAKTDAPPAKAKAKAKKAKSE